eukprot:TRINITY_DN28848_c0_g1_i3.p1 TRINITY_DN28848_c0_g1~~TRINITY_DN28848_c0_g1_i3.p1  ORF type:complete len:719 (-),score=111.62 TRINITY_DN28848_c0_g1_i3:263-2419(-)
MDEEEGVICVGFIGQNRGCSAVVNGFLGSNFNDEADVHVPHKVQSHFVEGNIIYLYLAAELPIDVIGGMQSVAAIVEERSVQLIRTTTLMFNICHIIFYVHKGQLFDMQYLKHFRTLQLAKQQLNASLHTLGPQLSIHVPALFSSSLYFPGRVLPVLSFIFVVPHGTTNHHRLQQSLEGQIRAVLRKAKLAGSEGPRTPIFMIDPQRMVFVLGHQTPNLGNDFIQSFVDLLNEPQAKATSPLLDEAGTRLIGEYITRQFLFFKRQMANIGHKYELPSLSVWEQLSGFLEQFISMGASGAKPLPFAPKVDPFDKVKGVLNPLKRLSQTRCHDAFIAAFDLFKAQWESVGSLADIDEFYQAKLADAEATYVAYAFGPAFAEYMRLLVDECAEFYESKKKALTQQERAAAEVAEGDLNLNDLEEQSNGSDKERSASSAEEDEEGEEEDDSSATDSQVGQNETLEQDKGLPRVWSLCNCGKTIATHGSVDLETAAPHFFARPCCEATTCHIPLRSKSTPGTSLVILVVGASNCYDKEYGLLGPEFLATENRLTPLHFVGKDASPETAECGLGSAIAFWKQCEADAPIAAAAPKIEETALAPKRKEGKRKRKQRELEAQREAELAAQVQTDGLTVFVGLEYEREADGKRWLLQLTDTQQAGANAKIHPLLAHYYPLVHKAADGSLSRIQRIYLVTPKAATRFAFTPALQISEADTPVSPFCIL